MLRVRLKRSEFKMLTAAPKNIPRLNANKTVSGFKMGDNFVAYLVTASENINDIAK